VDVSCANWQETGVGSIRARACIASGRACGNCRSSLLETLSPRLFNGDLQTVRSEHERSPFRKVFDTSNRKCSTLAFAERKAESDKMARLTRGFPLWAFLAIKPRAGNLSSRLLKK
jgi:hypothetical protein